jgi:hypothetical protein
VTSVQHTPVVQDGTARSRDKSELSPEEIEAQQADDLPDREAMSLINANAAIPVNAAVALNALSDKSPADAVAIQHTPITQQN